MSPLDYFFLDSSETDETPKEPTLGRKSPKKDKENNRQKLMHTLFLYLAVALGVFGQFIFAAFIQDDKSANASLGAIQVLLALIVGGVVFPTVYRSAGFNRRRPHPIQYFLAFQNGFFWQALLQTISKIT